MLSTLHRDPLGPSVRRDAVSSLRRAPASPNEQRSVDRLVDTPHLQVIRIVTDEARRDLLRRPVLEQPTLDFTTQAWVDTLADLGFRARLAAVFWARHAR